MAESDFEKHTVDLGGEEIEFTDEEMFGEHAGTVRKFREVAGNIMSVLAVGLLAVTLVAAGYAACVFHPFAVEKMAERHVNDASSPFTHEELVSTALATRDYAIAVHDENAYLEAIADINVSAAQDGRAGEGAPDMSGVPVAIFQETGKYDVEVLKAAFAEASEEYVITEDAMAHLDDVYRVTHKARPILGMIAFGALIACSLVSNTIGGRRLGMVLIISGGVMLAAFAALAAWAYFDFNALFTLFHSLFFAEGTWTFPADSLLICALPGEFWTGMAGVWASVSVAGCVICLIIGGLMRKGIILPEED